MAELWLALQNSSLSCLQRLKVATYLWEQEDVRKKKWSLLLKWTLDEVCRAHSKRARAHPPDQVRCQLWHLLSVMLESITTSASDATVELWAGETSPSVHFFQSVCDALTGVPKSNSDDHDGCGGAVQSTAYHVLKCVHCILTAPALPPMLHKFEIVVSLLQAVLDLSVHALSSPSAMGHLFTELFLTLGQLLKYFVYLQGCQGNPKKVFTSICQQLLPSVLKCINSQLKSLSLALFNQDHLAEFTSAVAVSDIPGAGQKRSAASYARLLFETLNKMAAAATEETDSCLAVIGGLPELYESFLHQNSQEEVVSKSVEFKFLTKLLVVLGMEEALVPSSTFADSAVAVETDNAADLELEHILRNLLDGDDFVEESGSNPSFLSTLSRCLELVWKFNVYQVGEDRDSGGDQFTTLQRLTLNIIRGLDKSCLVESFDCLAMMMRLNHKLLEPWLPSVWLLLMVAHRKLERDVLGRECIAVFVKLRQLPQLTQKLLESLELFREIRCFSDSTFSTFSPATEVLFAECVSKLPPGQCTETLELLLSHLAKVCGDVTRLKAGVRLDSYLPLLERAADILRLVLSHLPAGFWISKQKEKALQLLQTLMDDVLLPLLSACPETKYNTRLVSVILLLLSEYTELQSRLPPSILPHLKPLKMVWNEELGILIPEQWNETYTRDNLNSLGHHLLRKLALLDLRFFFPDRSSTTPQQLLAFILRAPPVPDNKTIATWNGQLLDVMDENEHLCYWSLILSHLPFVYDHLSKEQLEVVSKELVEALLAEDERRRDTEGTGERREGREEGMVEGGSTMRIGKFEGLAGVTLLQLVSVFFESEGFVEMNTLQELILNNFCTHLYSIMRTSIPKVLRKAMKAVSSIESAKSLQESSISSLFAVLQHGLEALHDPPSEETTAAASCFNSLKVIVPLIVQLIRNFQLSSLSQVTLLQSLKVFTALHVITTQQMHHKEHQKEPAALLEELNYLLSWWIHSLVRVREREARTIGGSKRRKRSSTGEMSEARATDVATFSSLLNLLSLYIYELMTLIQAFDVHSTLLASTMVAMEITLDAVVKMRGYPDDLLEKVVVDLQRKPKGDSPVKEYVSSVAERCMYIIANVSCKLLTAGQWGGADSEGSPLSAILEHTVAAIEKFITRKRRKMPASPDTAPLKVVREHPVLVSTLSLLLHRSPELVTARHVELVSLLCRTTEVCPTLSAADKPHIQFELFCGMVDLLSLPAAIAKSRLSPSTGEPEEKAAAENMDITNEGGEHVSEGENEHDLTSKSPLLVSWERLCHLLGYTFCEACQLENRDRYHLLHCLECTHNGETSSRFEKGKREDIFSMMCVQLYRTVSVLLTAASYEELQVILEQLLSVEDSVPVTVSSVMTFCFLWCIAVSVKLPQEKRTLIRRHLQKVLLVCQSITIQHSSDILPFSLVIQLVARLSSIPPSVGLDRISVLLALELSAYVSNLRTQAAPVLTASLVEGVTELLSAVLRQHVSVAISAPTPIVTAVNNLVRVAVELGRALAHSFDPTSVEVEICVNCANKVSRLMEMVSQKMSFTRFALYTIHVFLTSSQSEAATIHPNVKAALLPGIFNLLKLCSLNDIAFIKATVDPATRDTFQTLIEEYQRYHRFGGRV